MNKILGIMGSPRKNGNTHVLISKILESAGKKGATTELIFLNDLNIKECDGCHTCWNGNDCSKQDDMNALFQKIIGSDFLIFGTPVYWYGPTALLKAFLDRFVYFNCPENKEKLKGKSAIIVIPFEEENMETARPLLEMLEKSFQYLKLPLIEKVIVPGVTRRGEVAKKRDVMNKCLEIGEKISN